ncbi:MAG: DNA polymerase III subunit, partial [Bacteroidia bacterium]|nr:DNA polymerase III subunit [Bacteroidia bacterium]
MQFKDIIGHKRLIEQLLRNIKEGRVSHALLFNGPDGTGKLPLALAFTQYLMCENKSDTDSCGTCPSCIKNQKLVHPDVHFSFPFLKVNDKSSCNDTVNLFRESVLENSFMSLNDWNNIIEAEKKQTLITVTESNEIIHKLNLKSFESPYKVSFIWNVDKLKPNASTKLLKIIEEPPANTFFILIANSIESLLPTLVSRTQIISVNQLSKTDISMALIEKRGASENKAKTISQLSNGNYRTAIELLEDEENEDYVESFLEWMRLCFKASSETDKLLDWVDQ